MRRCGRIGLPTRHYRRLAQVFPFVARGSRILDVCTGNGAIARVAEEVACERGVHFEIDAFDGAEIASSGPERMIRFRSRVRAESLPYPDNSFDVVTGQYALEYTELSQSVPELARVSAPDSRVRLMAHASEGLVVGNARRQIDDARVVLDSGLFAAARELASQREANASETVLQALKERYNAAVRELEQAAPRSVEPEMYSNVCGVLTYALSNQPRVGARPVLDKIREAEDNIRMHATRLGAMTEAALDRTRAQALADRIGALWCREARLEAGQRANGDLLGWIIETA